MLCVCCGTELDSEDQEWRKDDNPSYDATMCGGCNASQYTVAGQEA
jgi:hypothetical protein